MTRIISWNNCSTLLLYCSAHAARTHTRAHIPPQSSAFVRRVCVWGLGLQHAERLVCGLNCSENTCCSNGFNMAVNYSQQSAVASVPLVWKWALLECLLATYSQLHQLRVQHLHFHAYFSRPHSLLEVSWVFGYSFLPLIFSMTSTCDQTFHAGFYAVGQTAWVSFRL